MLVASARASVPLLEDVDHVDGVALAGRRRNAEARRRRRNSVKKLGTTKRKLGKKNPRPEQQRAGAEEEEEEEEGGALMVERKPFYFWPRTQHRTGTCSIFWSISRVSFLFFCGIFCALFGRGGRGDGWG